MTSFRVRPAPLMRIIPALAALLLIPLTAILAADTPTDSRATSAAGVLVAAESFDYTPGPSLDGANGGSGWDGGWFHAPSVSGRNAVDDTNMSFATVATSGRCMLQTGGDVRSFRRLDTQRKEIADLVVDGDYGKTFGKEGTTLWIGFLIAVKSWPQVAYGGIHLCDGLGDLTKDAFGDKRAHQRIAMGRNNTRANWYLGRVTNGGPGAGKWEGTVRADDQPRFLVYRFDFMKSNVIARLFIDPAPGTEPAATAAAITANEVTPFHFNTLSAGAGGAARYRVDEIRIGTSFQVVAPSGR